MTAASSSSAASKPSRFDRPGGKLGEDADDGAEQTPLGQCRCCFVSYVAASSASCFQSTVSDTACGNYFDNFIGCFAHS